MESPNDTSANKSRTTSSYASAQARPRAKRFITGLEEFSDAFPPPDQSASAIASPSPAASNVTDSPFFSRAPSPIPRQHPSRASSLKPPTYRQDSTRAEPIDTGNGELSSALSGLWGKSWTSLQELASNVLGNDATSEVIKDNTRKSRLNSPTSSRPPTRSGWGPTGRVPSQPGAGSQQERSAIVRAKKREELLTAGANGYSGNAATNFKSRTSDDFGSTSAPPGESDDRDTFIYVHHVTTRDTMAGISIKYNCQLMTIKKVNRLWSNDGIQARKTLIIPLDACGVRGRRVAAPGQQDRDFLTGDASHDRVGNNHPEGERDFRRRPSSTITITPLNVSAHPNGLTDSPISEPPRPEPEESSTPWTHDHWVLLEGQTEKTEIARLPRSNLGFFPRTKRKSGSISSLERSSASLDYPHRPSITISDTTSSSTPSIHRKRGSSGSNQFASQMLGPGGVGSLNGRGPSTPGPAEDKVLKVFKKAAPPTMKLPSLGGSGFTSDDEFYSTSATSTPALSDFGSAVEGWAKKFGKGLAKALETPASGSNAKAKHMAPRQQRGGYSSTTGGDLIELAQAFEIGDDDDEEKDAQTPRVEQRGRRSSVDRFSRPSLGVPASDASRSRSHGGDSYRRKGD